MPIGASISAIGSLGSAAIGAYSANKASQAQANALSQGLQIQKGMFDTANTALAPYYTSGRNVLPVLQSLLTPGADQTATLSKLPGFQFESNWGTMATQNALAAEGLGGSTGPLAKAISDYNSGLASTNFSNLVSQLQGFAGMGSGAASALGSLAVNSGNSQAQTLGSIGTAQASGILGMGNAIGSGANGATNAFALPYLLSKFGANSGGADNPGIYG